MKTLAILLLSALSCVAQIGGLRSPAFVGNLAPRAASGPNAWYDVETVANTDTDANGTVDALEWSSVTVVTGGSATKARIYLGDNTGTPSVNLKMGIYAAGGGAVLASGSVANAGSAGDNAYVEVTFGTPVNVSSSTTYLVAWIADAGALDLTYRFKNGSGNWKAKLSYGYSNFPGTLPTEETFSLSRGYAVSLFVQ